MGWRKKKWNEIKSASWKYNKKNNYVKIKEKYETTYNNFIICLRNFYLRGDDFLICLCVSVNPAGCINLLIGIDFAKPHSTNS